MKIIKFLSAICIILITSCTSDDATLIDTNAQEEDLLGTWNLAEITQEGTTTTDIQGVPITVRFTSFGKDLNAMVTFTQNPNNFTSSGSYTSVLTTSILGQSTTEDVPVIFNNFLNTGSWELSQGMISITQNNETQTADITELTANSLKFEIELNEVIVVDGFTSTVNTRAKMTLTR